MPGVRNPAGQLLFNLRKVCAPFDIAPLQLAHATLESLQAIFAQPALVRPDVVTEKIQAAAVVRSNGENLCFVVKLQLQLVCQKKLDINAQVPQPVFVVVQDNEVIHVAHIVLFREPALDALVKRVKLDVFKKLAGQIADRDAGTGVAGCVIAVDNPVNQ